ncbi:MAG: cytochrome c [Bacteroidales bacterium]|jgi:nitrite reductase (NO-forming)|nr:cytochrome c [Bacteroidales bacterium]MDG2080761.1 cytochrome c [Bacteroidales bacterium]|tara:strand:- start:651 stop:1070 length:420 start_codon:yes stop_codon:yes gene_type:complete
MKNLNISILIICLTTFFSSAMAITPGDDPAATKYPEGAKIYAAKCVACHQVNGMGVPSAFPPLKDSDYLFADKKRAVEQVLNGSHEEMIVNGVAYNLPMAYQVDTHKDAVNVINYVLNAWGNKGGEITLDEVKDIKIVR